MSTTPLDSVLIDTPAGGLAVIADHGVVVAAGFAPIAVMAGRLPADLRERGLHGHDDLGPITAAVRAYFAGDLVALDDVPVRQPGGEFTQEVWRVMREIPAGQPWTYAELATKAGRPAAVRAVGTACARNLVAPFVPCHRVIRTGGALGGYYYGLPVKEWLLAHEAAAGTGRSGQHRLVDRV